MSASDAHRTIETVWRMEAPKLIAGLARLTRDIGRAMRVARAVQTGNLSINSGSSVHLEAPFGGVKQSGLGRELGLQALEHYSEWKTIYIDVSE